MLQYAALAFSAVDAISSISQGYAQRNEAEYNAQLLGEKSNMTAIQKDIDTGKYRKKSAQIWGTSMANVAAMGIKPSGSAMAVMLNAQKNIAIDTALMRFNYDMEKKYTMAEAGAQTREGDRAVRRGYTSGFSSILKGSYLASK